ncbi:FAD binding domain-containing protein [Xylariaceae sp. FL0255]|nr:FAD binding domain-containing protein [Xylariaceae sp. FL0255]
MPSDVDVLIIGGGPTGMTMALELAAQGVSFRILDKATSRSPYSRALVMQPRTLEVLKRHGSIEGLYEKGTSALGVTFAVKGNVVAKLEVGEAVQLPNTQASLQLSICQDDTEEWLENALSQRGVKVEMGVTAESIVQDAEGVTVVTTRADGSKEEIRTKYVVGGDGAHSAVRHAATNLTFDGEAYPQEFILVDCRMETQHPSGRAHFCLGTGVMVVLPIVGGRSRIVVSRPGQDTTREPTVADFEDFMQEIFPGGGKIHDVTWLTRFRLHHRGVNNYRDGRLFVAGDAAHIHSPAGGQGMNTGIQDAVNLGWKLAAVLRGEKPDSFLDSYNAERHPVGQHLLKNTDKMFSYVTTTNPIIIFLRNLILPWILPLALQSNERIRNLFMFQSQLRVRYRKSNIVGTAPGCEGLLRGGDRALDGKIKSDGDEDEKWLLDLFGPTSHHLVLFSGSGSKPATESELRRAEDEFLGAAKDAVKVHTIFNEGHSGNSGYVDVGNDLHRVYGFNDAGYALVRPDGYIAHIGPLTAVESAAEWL